MSGLTLDGDLYARLGVERSATTEEIAAAFRARAKAMHPDRRPGDADAAEQFKALTQAYGVLTNPARRAAYDRRQAVAPTPPPAPPAPTHQPVFRTPRAARTARWAGVVLFALGVAGTVVLLSVPTGDAPKTITLWLVVAKLLLCGPALWATGTWRLWHLRAVG